MLFTALLITSCSFDFSEDYYKEIELVEPSSNLNFRNFRNGETLSNSKVIDYNLNISGDNQLFGLSINIDNVEVSQSYTLQGSFYIGLENLEDGEHTLDFVYNLKSESGSMADIFGLEIYQVKESFIFTVDKSLVTPFEIKTIEIKDGTIYLNWDKIEDNNYPETYLLIQDGYQFNEILLTQEILESKRYHDNLSVSDKITYSIKTRNSFEEKYGEEKVLDLKDIFKVTLEIDARKALILKWNEHPLYANFDCLSLSFAPQIDIDKKGGERILNSYNPFGSNWFVNFNIVRDSYNVGYVENELYLGDRFNFQFLSDYYYDTVHQKLYGLELVGDNYYGAIRKVVLHHLDSDNLSLIKSTEVGYTEYSFAQFAKNTNGNMIVNLSDFVLELDPTSLSILKKYETSDYYTVPQHYQVNTSYINGTLIVEDYNNYGEVRFYNATTKELVNTLKKKSVFKVSKSGNFFIINHELYSSENGNITKLYELTNPDIELQSIVHVSHKDEIILSYISNHPIVFNINTTTTSEITALTNVSNMSYDSASQKVLLFQGYYRNTTVANVYDSDTKKINSLQCTNFGFQNYFYQYQNNILIAPNGYYIKNYFD